MAPNENKPHRSHKWTRILASLSYLENVFMSFSVVLFLFVLVFSEVSNASSLPSTINGQTYYYSRSNDNNYYGDNQVVLPNHQREYRTQSFRSPLDDNVPFIAAFAGISLFTAAFGVSLLVNDGGNTMMKSLMSPFGFGRTSPSSSDVANRIPNIEASEGSYDEQGPIERIFEVADSWSRAVSMDECGQAAICEAHANNRDYGLIALPILFFFPGTRGVNGNPASVWQEAALRGKARDSCSSRYSCIINPLWIVKFLMTTLVY